MTVYNSELKYQGESGASKSEKLGNNNYANIFKRTEMTMVWNDSGRAVFSVCK